MDLKYLQACRKGQADVQSTGGCGEAEVQILALMGVLAAQAGGGHGDKAQGAALLSIRLLPGMRQGADWGPCWDLMAESGLCKNLSLAFPPTDPPVHCFVCQSQRRVLLSGEVLLSHLALRVCCRSSRTPEQCQGCGDEQVGTCRNVICTPPPSFFVKLIFCFCAS